MNFQNSGNQGSDQEDLEATKVVRHSVKMVMETIRSFEHMADGRIALYLAKNMFERFFELASQRVGEPVNKLDEASFAELVKIQPGEEITAFVGLAIDSSISIEEAVDRYMAKYNVDEDEEDEDDDDDEDLDDVDDEDDVEDDDEEDDDDDEEAEDSAEALAARVNSPGSFRLS